MVVRFHISRRPPHPLQANTRAATCAVGAVFLSGAEAGLKRRIAPRLEIERYQRQERFRLRQIGASLDYARRGSGSWDSERRPTIYLPRQRVPFAHEDSR